MKKFEVKLLLDAIDKYCYKKNKDADFKNKLINDVKESVDYVLQKMKQILNFQNIFGQLLIRF